MWGTTRRGEPVEHVDRLVPIDELAAAAAEVDAIVATLPGTAHTTGLIGADVLGAVRDDTILVNVGRGTVVDEDALLDALDAGRIGFAALDVTAVHSAAAEPLPAGGLHRHPPFRSPHHTASLVSIIGGGNSSKVFRNPMHSAWAAAAM